MYVKATINCECGCIFHKEFQGSSINEPPKCPECQKVMSTDIWKSLRTAMAEYADCNQHVIKYASERGEPRMQIPALVVATHEI